MQEYITNENGEKVLIGTRRPDGTLRKERRIRAGYIPQDEQPVYESRGMMVRVVIRNPQSMQRCTRCHPICQCATATADHLNNGSLQARANIPKCPGLDPGRKWQCHECHYALSPVRWTVLDALPPCTTYCSVQLHHHPHRSQLACANTTKYVGASLCLQRPLEQQQRQPRAKQPRRMRSEKPRKLKQEITAGTAWVH